MHCRSFSLAIVFFACSGSPTEQTTAGPSALVETEKQVIVGTDSPTPEPPPSELWSSCEPGIFCDIYQAPSDDPLHDVWASDDGRVVVATGESGLHMYSGGSWRTVANDGLYRGTLEAVWGSGPDDIWVVGGGNPPPGQMFSGDLIHWDGMAWEKIDPPILHNELNAVAGRAADDVWVTGQWGNVYHFDGKKWRSFDFKSHRSYDIFFSPDGTVYTINEAGEVFGTEGDTFKKVAEPSFGARGWAESPSEIYAGSLFYDGKAWSRSPAMSVAGIPITPIARADGRLWALYRTRGQAWSNGLYRQEEDDTWIEVMDNAHNAWAAGDRLFVVAANKIFVRLPAQ